MKSLASPQPQKHNSSNWISVSRVILACGGFERNEQMRVKYQRAPITTEWTVGATANTGDGIIAAEKLGAALDIMEDAWWGPTVPLVGAPWFACPSATHRARSS
jgi:succinate dehydrogenase/fumarate reductase flavoprotein subunit